MISQKQSYQQQYKDFPQGFDQDYKLHHQSEWISMEQNYFADQLSEISERYIPTSYGQIYSITAGSSGQPLILVVHGSGPRNSSSTYKFLLQEYLVRISYIEKFYIVAIDCPGYGKSIGSKQAVKTFPKQMFEEILKALNYKQYFAMVGHSQGGAAIFNAIYQDSLLSQLLIMDRPVCGNIQRFRKFNIPTLLIYDVEDDGHPVWQGKLLYKELTYSEFFTYKSSQHPYWIADNLWNKILNFFGKYANNRKGRTNIFSTERAFSFSPSVKNQNLKKNQKKVNQISNWQQNQQQNQQQKSIEIKRNSSKSSSMSKSKKQKYRSLDQKKSKEFIKSIKNMNSKAWFNQLEIVEQMQREKEGLLSVYSSSFSEQQKEQLAKISSQMKQKEQELLKDQKKKFLKKKKPYEIDQKFLMDQSEEQKEKQNKVSLNPKVKSQSIIEKKQGNKLNEQEQNYRCAICYDIYYRPIQTNCNHIFCTKCLLESLLVNPRCPLCRANVTKKTEKKELHNQVIALMKQLDIQKRQKAYLKLKLMLDSIVMVQIGNRAIELQTKKSYFSKTKKKYMWELFAKQNKNFKFQEFSFNINMGDSYSRPVKLKNAPFVFESRGTFSFSCEIFLKPKNHQYAPLTTIYRIKLEPGIHTQTIAFKKKIYLKE